jgi:hypothetical protein
MVSSIFSRAMAWGKWRGWRYRNCWINRFGACSTPDHSFVTHPFKIDHGARTIQELLERRNISMARPAFVCSSAMGWAYRVRWIVESAVIGAFPWFDSTGNDAEQRMGFRHGDVAAVAMVLEAPPFELA